MRYVIGIDPGKKGAVAVLRNSVCVGVWDTPLKKGKSYDGKGMYELLYCDALLRIRSGVQATKKFDVVAVIEKQQAFGRDSRGASFTTGSGYGRWLQILDVLSIPYIEVPPKKWQAQVGIAKTWMGDTKKASLMLACKLFPEVQFDGKDGRSDAALIAVWGKEIGWK